MVATVDTWDLDPEFPVELVPNRHGDVSPGSAGYVTRRDSQNSVSVTSSEPTRRTWKLRWKNACAVDKTRVVAIWEASARGALAIAFTPPGGSATPVRMMPGLRITRTAPTSYAFTVELEELTNA